MSKIELFKAPLYIALMHYPIFNKNKEISTSSITNLDIHDICRLSRTYGVSRFFVVHPLEAQRDLASKIIHHWTEGFGASYNPKRQQALSVASVVEKFSDTISYIKEENDGREPLIAVTKARAFPDDLTYEELSVKIATDPTPVLLVLGTGWGLTDEFLESAHIRLSPLRTRSDFRHLSVRSAASIILDRILGDGLLPQ